MSANQNGLPRTILTVSSADTTVAARPQRVLVIGQKIAGTATTGDLQQDIQNDNSWDTLFGKKSRIAAQIRAFRKINPFTSMDAIGLDDNGAAVDATGTVVFAGTATAAGTLTFYVGSKINNIYTVAVASGDTATVVGDALVAAIAADTVAVVSAANVTGTVTLTALNGGTVGNDIGIASQGSVAGITSTITGMASGATDPSLTGLFDVVGDDRRYQTVIWPYDGDLTTITAFLDPRFNATNNILNGVAVTTSVDTFANLSSAASAENSESLVYLGNKSQVGVATQTGGAMTELSDVISAQVAAVRSLRLEPNVSLGTIIAAGGLDRIGGVALSSLPYFNTAMQNLPLVPLGLGFSDVEVKSLNSDGVSFVGNNRTANQVILGEMLTTYKTDNAGNPDDSFKFLNFVDTITAIREHIFNQLGSDFVQTRLTAADASIVAGRDVTNENQMRATIVGYYSDLATSDFALTQGGEAALQFFRDNLNVSINLQTGAATITMKAPIVTQLRSITGDIEIVFEAA